jgi:hypothetical protein
MTMKKLLLALFALLVINDVQAQLGKTDDVKKQLQTENKDTVAFLYGGVFNLGFNEGFLHNWAAGGELASITANAVFSGFTIKMNHRHIWTNNLDLNYGLFYAYSNDFVPRKTDDRIDFTSKYGIRLDTASDFYLTGLFNFKSQLTEAYDYALNNWDTSSTSRFFSPAYFTLALGMEYRKGSNLSLFLSPIAARLTFVDKYYTMMNPQGAFGVEYGKTTRTEVGAYFSGRYMVDITKNLSFKTRLDLYCNYLAKNSTDSLGNVVKKDNPGNIDILFDNLFAWKVSKYIALTLGATMIYDNDIPFDKNTVDDLGAVVPKDEPGLGLGWVQMKQVFTVGFIYKF